MPRNGQIIPSWNFPHTETFINDYSEISNAVTAYSSSSGITYMLHVFTSPKGRDGELMTINNGLTGFINEFGLGSGVKYGQPYMNAYASASTGAAVLQCLRVTDDAATYSNITVYAAYKTTITSDQITKSEYDGLVANGAVSGLISNGADVEEVEDLDEETTLYYKASKSFKVKFIAGSNPNVNDTTNISNIGPLDVATATADRDTAAIESDIATIRGSNYDAVVPLFTVVSRGKGTYGKEYAIKFSNIPTLNKQNAFQNYNFQVLDSANSANNEYYSVVVDDEAAISGASLYIDDLVNDPVSGSNKVRIYTYIDSFASIYDEYKTIASTDLEFGAFDFLLGVNKTTKQGIDGYNIVVQNPTGETLPDGFEVVSFNATYGITLKEGSDGFFDEKNITDADLTAYNTANSTTFTKAQLKEKRINDAYVKAFSGVTDPHIKSKTRFPVTMILDANYEPNIKALISSLATARTDCVAMFDCGTEFYTKESIIPYVRTNLSSALERVHTVVPLYGKVREPYASKLMTVTWTYLAASAIPYHFARNNGKHVPFAGANYGILDGFVNGTAFPVFEQDLDADIMEQLIDENINYAKYLLGGSLCIATQNTRQTKLTDLSELNAVLILLDVKRDVENLVSNYEYLFNDAEMISVFNRDVKTILGNYQGTQVRSIEANFESNEWESERNILHLYVTLVNRDLVKTVLIEIDVNQN